jgi:putative colanic acid biosynthesis acetyltransferase WcaF
VSQYAYLCGATHDHTHPRFPLTPMPIDVGSQCWIAADVFVAPGVTIGDGTVVGARSSVFSDLPPWKVCVGSPARPVSDRVINADAPAHAAAPKAPEPADNPHRGARGGE